MSWNHRILAHEKDGEIYLQIHEVHYDENNIPYAYGDNSSPVGGDDIKEIKWVLNKMIRCCKQPILCAGDKFPEEYSVSKSAFIWSNRYSNNDDKDKHGRWARICYFKGKMIAWVSRVDHIDYGRYYRIVDYFPSVQNDSPCLVVGMEREKDFETIKKEIEQRFTEFLQAVC